MPIPEFIVELRKKIGHDFLWLSGVTGVVTRTIDGFLHVLLIQRKDNHEWTPITGVLDPMEEPADAVEREILEEASVVARAVRLASVKSGKLTTHVNGDKAAYLDMTFECEWISGEGEPDMEETLNVRWCPADDLPPMNPTMQRRIQTVLEGSGTVFTRDGNITQSQQKCPR